MRIVFVNTVGVDFGLFDIDGITICERLIKMLLNFSDMIYIIANEDSIDMYKKIVDKYDVKFTFCNNVRNMYTSKDFVIFCDCNILFFNIDNLRLYLEKKSEFFLVGKNKVNETCFVLFHGGNYKKEKNVFDVIKVKNYETYSSAINMYRYKKCLHYIKNGVKIIDVNSTYIGDDVVIEKGVIIYPNSFIFGDTYIGEGTIIYPNSVIESSFIYNSCVVGPFANIKKGSKIGANSYIGAFVEVKNSCLKNNVKAKHHAYLGDVEVEENCNIGCGVIFANYDGKKKHRSKVEKNVFIGSNVTIVSPVNIGENSLIGAGSTIVLDVERNSLAIARNKQINKIDYYNGNKS